MNEESPLRGKMKNPVGKQDILHSSFFILNSSLKKEYEPIQIY